MLNKIDQKAFRDMLSLKASQAVRSLAARGMANTFTVFSAGVATGIAALGEFLEANPHVNVKSVRELMELTVQQINILYPEKEDTNDDESQKPTSN